MQAPDFRAGHHLCSLCTRPHSTQRHNLTAPELVALRPSLRGTELPPHILLQYTRAYEATDKRGSIVSDPAFTSTTATPRETYKGPHTIIVEKPDAGQKSRGSHMADFAENRAEDEVLFPPGTPFRVLDMQRGDNDTVTFILKEVIP